MTKYQPEWILNLSLQLAMAICLTMLVLGLFVGVAPLTVLWRSGLVFVVFLLLAWATSLIWQIPEPLQAALETESETAPNTEESAEN